MKTRATTSGENNAQALWTDREILSARILRAGGFGPKHIAQMMNKPWGTTTANLRVVKLKHLAVISPVPYRVDPRKRLYTTLGASST